MHRFHGLGIDSCPQIGRNTFRRDDFQRFHQNRPEQSREQGEAQWEVWKETSKHGPTSNITGERSRSRLRQSRTKNEIANEEGVRKP
jgi:hypothetical protein